MHFLIQHNEISKTHQFRFLPQKKVFICRLVLFNYVSKVIFAPLAGLEMRVTQIFLLFFRNSFSLFTDILI